MKPHEKGKFIPYELKRDTFFPAILDPNNEDYLLCIGHDTKTGYRVAFPMSPSGYKRNCTWIEEFNLVQPMNLPDLPSPLERRKGKKSGTLPCSHDAGQWFRNHQYGFTPHALRHAYNIRGHKLGVNQKALADSLGHSVQMNGRNYLRNEGAISKIQGIKNLGKQANLNQQIELKRANDKIADLEADNEKLRTELAMYKAIEQNKNSN